MRGKRIVPAALAVVFAASGPVLAADAGARAKLEKKGFAFTPEGFLQAVNRGDKGAFELFLKAGIDVNAPGPKGRTALHVAAEQYDPSLVAPLLQAKAEVNARDADGRTPLWHAVHGGGDGRVKATTLLLGAGADVKARYDHGETLLHVASDNGPTIAILLKAGAEVEGKDQRGQTPLYAAACFQRQQALALLIQAGADVNARAEEGETPLMCATRVGNAAAVRQLLQAKADAKATAPRGETALITAAEMIPSWVQDGRIPAAAITQLVQDLVAAGTPVNAVAEEGQTTALLEAVKKSNRPMVEALLAAGADPNVKPAGDGITALMQAAKNGEGELVAALVAAKADVNAADARGRTVLQWAQDDPDITRVLVAAGAKPAAPARKK